MTIAKPANNSDAGFFCPLASQSSQAENCAPDGTAPDQQQSYYCPAGTTARLRTADTTTSARGEYSGVLNQQGQCVEAPSDDPQNLNRQCAVACPSGYVCLGGRKLNEFDWVSKSISGSWSTASSGFVCTCSGGLCTGTITVNEIPDE